MPAYFPPLFHCLISSSWFKFQIEGVVLPVVGKTFRLFPRTSIDNNLVVPVLNWKSLSHFVAVLI